MRSTNAFILAVVTAGCGWLASTPAQAQWGCCNPCWSAPCCTPAPTVTYEQVEKTILVPTMVTETRKIWVTECRAQERTRTYTVCRAVPETHDVVDTYTVMVPQQRTRTETYRVCKPVTRQVTSQYTVQVPYQERRQATRKVCKYVQATETRTISVPENHTRTETYTVCKPVMRQVAQNYTVTVPYQETREGTRQVCRWVPVTEQHTVCEDQGHYEERCMPAPAPCYDPCMPCCGRLLRRRCCSSPCGAPTGCGAVAGCGDACAPTITCKVWVSNIVQKIVNVTVNKPQMFTETYQYPVTLCRQETRTRTVNVCDMTTEQKTREVPYVVCVPKQESYTVNKPVWVDEPYSFTVTLCRTETRNRVDNVVEYQSEERTREVPYTVCVPQQRTRTRQVTTVKMVPEQRTDKYTVQVPYPVEKEIQVQVCRMVPKTIMVTVAVPCAPAAPCCGTPASPCDAPAAAAPPTASAGDAAPPQAPAPTEAAKPPGPSPDSSPSDSLLPDPQFDPGSK